MWGVQHLPLSELENIFIYSIYSVKIGSPHRQDQVISEELEAK